MTDKKLVQIRISEDVVKATDRLSVEWDSYRNEAIERLLREAIDRYVKPGARWPWALDGEPCP